MSRLAASAPGKLILCGEYAVLDGAPAVAMAVDRRAVVTVQADGRGDNTDGALFESVRSAIGEGAADDRSFVLDTSAFVDGKSGAKRGVKLGIGSSAALTVALARVLAPDSSTEDVADFAQRAHRVFQGGVGSGVDIATSIVGGLIEYRMSGCAITAIQWPDGLRYALLWSGVAVSTRERLEQLARLENAEPLPSRTALADAAIATAMAWRTGSSSLVLTATQDYVDVLQSYSVDHGLGIFEAGHDVLVRNAMNMATVYKPCGAGGGDMGIALATSETDLQSFVGHAEEAGFKRLPMALDTRGVSFGDE